MKGETTLAAALAAWLEWRRGRESEDTPDERVPSMAELHDFLQDPDGHPRRDAILESLGDSGDALLQLRDALVSRQIAARRMQGWDCVLIKAAASRLEGLTRITTERGCYDIEIRPSVHEAAQVAIVVRVTAANREALEGRRLVLRDGTGRILGRGRVIDGEMTQVVEELHGLPTGLAVMTEDDEP